MEKKTTTKKASSKKATTETPKKAEQGAKVSNSAIVEVVVTADKFGTYKKGDTIKMHVSTAKGCIASKVVEMKK
jgi:hypothetical protein